MRYRLVGAIALFGSLALLCSACGGNPSAASHDKHHSGGSHSSTTSTPTSSTSTTTSTTTGSRCQYAELSITAGQPGAGLGHEGAAILFKNTGTSACTLSGYPGVAALDQTGSQASQAQRTPSGYLGGMETGSKTPPLVQLAPGAVASAMVEGTDVPEGTATSCPTYPALLVTPPTSTQSTRLALSLPGCSPLQIHPVVSGSTGSTKPPA